MILLKSKKVAILGLMDPGIAMIRFAAKQGGRIKAYGVATENEIKRIHQLLPGISFELITQEVPVTEFLDQEVILLTPGGGKRYQAQIEAAKQKGISVLTDLEVACEYYNAPIIAVTGTNGKSTVVHMIQAAIEAAGKKALMAGGDYADFAESVLNPKPYDYAVLEVNSSRLKRVGRFHPHIAVFLNIYPGHSERHASFKEYAEAKAKIFAEQNEKDALVFSLESVGPLVKEKNCKARTYPFSVGTSLKRGGYLDVPHQQIFFADGEGGLSSFSSAAMRVAGTHNIQNALAAVCVAKLCGFSDSSIQQMLNTVGSLPDRMEFVQKVEGIKYYNDAKAVNAIATYSVLHGLEDRSVVLIGGGAYSPHSQNKYLMEMIRKKVRCLILFGTERREFHKIWGNETESYVVPTLKDAVELASKKAENGNVVLFSPAARAELHVHGSTQKRGEEFRRLVRELAEMSKARKVLQAKV